jgi:hypothetical protein
MPAERSTQHSENKKKSPDTHLPVSTEGEYFSPMDTSQQHVLYLQRTVGNQAVQRLLAQRRLHPTLQRQEDEEAQPAPIQPVQEVTGEIPADGPDETDHGRVIRLEGRTTAEFSQSHNTFASENTSLTRAEGCGDCAENDPCVRVTTTIVCTYSVPIHVDLPDLSAMDLNECERQQCQNWIDTVLNPHEQQHVAAFQTYNGTTRRPLTFTCCNSQAQTELDTRAEAMMQAEQVTRQAAAQTTSDALDPFNMDFEVNCPEPEESTDAEATEEAAEPVE